MNGQIATSATIPDVQNSWIDRDTALKVEFILDFYFVISFGLFGLVANVINICVFVRQGQKDSTNLKLLCLAVVDFFVVLSLLVVAVCRLVDELDDSAMALSSKARTYLFAWPRIPLNRAGACVTVLITLERCLCIVIPLRVKHIFTRKTLAIALSLIAALFLLILIPHYIPVTFTTLWRRNKSVIIDVLIGSDFRFYNDISVQPSVTIQFLSYIVMVFATIFLINGLKLQGRKRQAMLADPVDAFTDASKTDTRQSTRDLKIMRMVAFIASMFVLCSLPEFAMTVLHLINPEVSLVGAQANTFRTGWAFARAASCVNSSANIVIYMAMNSAFRKTLRSFFS